MRAFDFSEVGPVALDVFQRGGPLDRSPYFFEVLHFRPSVGDMIAARVALEGAVRAIDKDIDPKGMTDADLRKAAVAAQLRDGDRAVSSAPWLVELDPADSPLEDSPLLWGRPAVEIYRRGVSNQSDADVLDELASVRGFDPGSLQPMAGARVAGLAPHQIETTSVAPEQGRRAAIMVTHLRPLLQACGEGGALLAA